MRYGTHMGRRLPAWIAPGLAALSLAGGAAADEYRYGGFQSATGVTGIAATVTAVAAPKVQTGHVAAWVGVSGPSASGRGQQWLQIGLAGFTDGTMGVYVEIERGSFYRWTAIMKGVVGQSYRFAVVREPDGSWAALLNGKRVGPRAGLDLTTPKADATAENWTLSPESCNSFSYRVGGASMRTSSAWKPFSGWLINGPGIALTGTGSRFAVRSTC